LIKEIGGLQDRAEEFVTNEGSQALIKLYKSSNDPVLKQESLSLLKGKQDAMLSILI
jgi:hypothetical protein